MSSKRIVLMCERKLVGPFRQNGYEAFWTYPLVYSLFYGGEKKVPFDKKEFETRLNSYEDEVLRFGPTHFFADQFFFTALHERLERIEQADMSRLWISFVEDLNRRGIVTIIHCHDDPKRFLRKKDIIPLTHAFQVVVTHSIQMERRYVRHRQRVIHMPNWVTLDCIDGGGQQGRSSPETDHNFKSDFDLFFAGRMNFFRRNFFRELARRISDLDYFFGTTEYHYTSRKKIDFDATDKLHLKRIYRDSAINVIYGSTCDLIVKKSWGPTQRVYDVPYCHGFFLCDYRRDLDKLFDVPPDIYTFRTPGQCHKKIRYFLKNAHLRKPLTERFNKQVVENHTADRRVKDLIYELERDG